MNSERHQEGIMETRSAKRLLASGAILCAGMFMILACGGGQAAKKDTAPAFQEKQLDKKYTVVRLFDTEIDPKIAADYPTAVAEYESSLLFELRSKNRFREVEKNAQPVKGKQSALYVKSKVTGMRIVSGSARFWWGAAAGTSDMIIDLKLIDSKSGSVVKEATLSSANNPFGAVFAGGSSDRSLPTDVGKIVATYILAVVPEK
jgi:hypothetical protein